MKQNVQYTEKNLMTSTNVLKYINLKILGKTWLVPPVVLSKQAETEDTERPGPLWGQFTLSNFICVFIIRI